VLPEKKIKQKYKAELKKAAVHRYQYLQSGKHVQFSYYQTTLAKAKELSLVLEIPLQVFEQDFNCVYEKYKAKEGEKKT
jgi:hypothetical protein